MRRSRTFAPLLYPGILKEAQLVPVGRVDEMHDIGYPLEGAEFAPRVVTVGKPLYVRGWALWPVGPNLGGAVLVGVDGFDFVEAEYGSDRPDIASHFGLASASKSGFSVVLSTEKFPAGEHELKAVVVNAALTEYVEFYRQRFTLVNGRIRMCVAMPRARDVVVRIDEIRTAAGSFTTPLDEPLRLSRNESLYIRGWAIDRDAGRVAAGCAVLIDMAECRSITYGLPRFDVARAEGVPEMAYCGYEVLVSASNLASGPHEAIIAAVSADGEAFSTAVHAVPFSVEDFESPE